MGYFRDTIEKMDGYTPGFQPKNPDAVKLNTNENPYPPSPKVLETVSKISDFQLRRYPDPMGGAFRQAASEVFGLPEDHIICVNGGDELLNYAFRAFCDANRPTAWAEPTYSLYPVLAKLQECPAIMIDRQGDWLEELARINAAMTIVCNPNAPTGEFTEVDKIAALAKRLSGVLLVDEAYVDFSEDNCLRLVKQCPNVLVLRSMSKGYSLAGLRAGLGFAQPKLIEGLVKVKDSYNIDAVAIQVAAAAVRDQSYHKQCVQKVKAERRRVIDRLRQLNFIVPDSAANFVLAQCVKTRADVLFEKLAAQDIYVRYFRLPGLEDKLRITVGTPEQNDKLLAAIQDIIKHGEVT
ncbi:MAG: histidinol-phosphate transaminase [Planctomycetes bacterium]|nr:histidinol-phosphate transaminase [Planctomycetota bacterium]